MARITVEDCLREENNRFALVQLAAKRTKQLLHGSRPVIEDPRGNKSVVTSLREIASGKVRFMNEDELREAEEKEREEARLQAEREANAATSDISIADLLFGGVSSIQEEAALVRGDLDDDDSGDELEADADDSEDDADDSDDDTDDGEGADEESADSEEDAQPDGDEDGDDDDASNGGNGSDPSEDF